MQEASENGLQVQLRRKELLKTEASTRSQIIKPGVIYNYFFVLSNPNYYIGYAEIEFSLQEAVKVSYYNSWKKSKNSHFFHMLKTLNANFSRRVRQGGQPLSSSAENP